MGVAVLAEAEKRVDGLEASIVAWRPQSPAELLAKIEFVHERADLFR